MNSISIDLSFIKIILNKYKISIQKNKIDEKIYNKLIKRLNILNNPKYLSIKFYRSICDYLMKNNKFYIIKMIIEEFDLFDYVDFDIYRIIEEIRNDLINRNVSSCLKWCDDNLKGSQLEFELKKQVFIGLIKENKMKALKYSQNNFKNYDYDELKCIMILLISPENIDYNEFFDDRRWVALSKLFIKNLYDLLDINNNDDLIMYLEAGLSAYKCKQCYNKDKDIVIDCPVCSNFNIMSSKLPYSKHNNSYLICRYTNEIINEKNPPLILPKGQLYSSNAIKILTNNKYITCPKTKIKYHINTLKRCYITK